MTDATYYCEIDACIQKKVSIYHDLLFEFLLHRLFYKLRI